MKWDKQIVGYGGGHTEADSGYQFFPKWHIALNTVGILTPLLVNQELTGKLGNKMVKSANTQVLSANIFSKGELIRIYFI